MTNSKMKIIANFVRLAKYTSPIIIVNERCNLYELLSSHFIGRSEQYDVQVNVHTILIMKFFFLFSIH